MSMFLSLFLLVLFNSSLFANDLFIEANALYENNKYSEANELYRKIIYDNNIFSSSLYMNLASSYAMLGSNGYAVLWYERALRLNAFDSDINRSLRFVRDEQNNYSFLLVLKYVLVIIFILLFSLGILFYILYIKLKNYKKLFSILFLSTLSLSIFFLVGIFVTQTKLDTEYIIVIDNDNIYKGASTSNKASMGVKEGSKLFLLDENEDWFYVKSSFGELGWILKKSTRRI